MSGIVLGIATRPPRLATADTPQHARLFQQGRAHELTGEAMAGLRLGLYLYLYKILNI